MDPMYDLNSWSKQRREEALRETQRRSLAEQGKGDRSMPYALRTGACRLRLKWRPGPAQVAAGWE